jgi:beta-mannosidase
VTSWSIVDYLLRPKPAYFAIARELRPYTVGMTRKDVKRYADERTLAHFTITSQLEIWGTNGTLEKKDATLQVTSFDLARAEWSERWETGVSLAPNASTELWKGPVPGQPTRTRESDVPKTIVVSARLLDVDQDRTVLARYSNWSVFFFLADFYVAPVPRALFDEQQQNGFLIFFVTRPEPFKYIHFPDVKDLGFKITPSGAGGETVVLSTERPIKGIVLDVEGDEVRWGDQAIDLVPGDPQTVKAIGLNGRTAKARFLGDGTA